METTAVDTQIPQHVLCFRLEQEFFAVNVIKVVEIMEVPKISKIPKSPSYMTGVINVRNFMIPLVDTRIKLGMEATQFTVDTCVVVAEINTNGERLAVGILVDEVLEVADLGQEAVRPAPKFETNEYEKFIVGMFTKEENYAMILNLDEVFSLHDIIELESVTQSDEKKTEKPKAEKKRVTKKITIKKAAKKPTAKGNKK